VIIKIAKRCLGAFEQKCLKFGWLCNKWPHCEYRDRSPLCYTFQALSITQKCARGCDNTLLVWLNISHKYVNLWQYLSPQSNIIWAIM